LVLIISFSDQETADIFNGVTSKKARKKLHPILWEKAQAKLDMLNRAFCLDDLKIPPNNKLEKLQRHLIGKYSIRINDQYRIIFQWDTKRRGVLDVKITDYH
jgi:proteic killer suppression protein